MERRNGSLRGLESEQISSMPSGFRGWENRSIPIEERFSAYKAHVGQQVQDLADAAAKLGDLEFLSLRASPAAQELLALGEELQTMTAEEFRLWFDPRYCRALLGKNFLGAEEWKAAFGADVGAVPPIPASITKALLESESPLHPREKMKDTHLLVLVPKTVNDEPYNMVMLDGLCATRKGSGHQLVYDGRQKWKSQPWASTPPAASEWVLLSKRDPDPSQVCAERHFRDKRVAEQQRVHDEHYREYREAKAAEVMTAALLNDLINKERLFPDSLRCQERSTADGRACVGRFFALGVRVYEADKDDKSRDIGRALARTL